MYLQVSRLKYFGKVIGKSFVSSRNPTVRHAYEGANFVPIAVPSICLHKTLSNRKLSFFRTKLAASRMNSLENRSGIRSHLSLIQNFNASSPSS